MVDLLNSFGDSPAAPARQCFVVTPNDTQALPFVTKALRAGGSGTITLRAVDATSDVAHPVRDGERIDVRVTHVRATGTDVPVLAYA